MDVGIRTIAEDEYEACMRALDRAFSGATDPEELEMERPLVELDRSHAAVEGDRIVGAALASTFRMTVPGGATIPIAGVTGVGVLPSHRRRGVNTALMRAQLDDVRRRGEVAAALYASEAGIYGRFGYGIATFDASIDLETARSAFVTADVVPGRIDLLDHQEALPRIRPIQDADHAARPGSVVLDDAWFERIHRQTESERKEEPYFFAVHRDDGGVDDAYAVYRVSHDWSGEVPNQELKARDVRGRTPESLAAIWRFLCDVDLVRRVTAGALPTDAPLLDLLVEPRRLNLKVRDGMFLRLLDVPAAMAARRFAGDGDLVLEVADPFLPELEGCFGIVVRDGTAECARTAGAADLSCSVVELGAAYLGGTSFRRLARARRVRELREGALARADSMFAWDPAPWCALHF